MANGPNIFQMLLVTQMIGNCGNCFDWLQKLFLALPVVVSPADGTIRFTMCNFLLAFSVRRYASAVYAVVVCLSVCVYCIRMAKLGIMEAPMPGGVT